MIAPAASFAIGTPVILLKNGTVLELRGLTSSTNTSPLLITYWIFNSPTMFNPFASLIVYSINLSFSPSVNVWGGYTAIESPEWTPALSMCSIIPGIITVSPSLIASTSISRPTKYLSVSTGCSGVSFTAVFM